MGNANINEKLKIRIEKILEKQEFKIRYQNLKGFIDNACLNELSFIKNNSEK